MTLALPVFQHSLKQNKIDATDKNIQLDIIQYLKNAFTSYYMPPIKENTVRKQYKTSINSIKPLTGIIAKMDPKER